MNYSVAPSMIGDCVKRCELKSLCLMFGDKKQLLRYNMVGIFNTCLVNCHLQLEKLLSNLGVFGCLILVPLTP